MVDEKRRRGILKFILIFKVRIRLSKNNRISIISGKRNKILDINQLFQKVCYATLLLLDF